MEWLNYHHLHYFWLVAREGGLAPAATQLRLAPSTVSGQIRLLQDALGHELFVRSGRRLVLTEIGRVVYGYADEIFGIGRELQDTLKDRPAGRPLRVTVGVADVVPKLVARRLLEPALHLREPVRLVCREDRPDRLLAELALHELDMILTDAPASPQVKVRSFSHLLLECDVAFLGRRDLALKYRRGFPSSLHGAPLLLPTENTALRRSIDQWLDASGARPRVVAEIEDSALLKVFGQTGLGLFPVAAVVAREVCRQYDVEVVGKAAGLCERFYAVTVERRLRHPAVVAICEAATEQSRVIRERATRVVKQGETG
jgi:LysR family transcriptional activator of nhaA